jgi:hypothetical protein
MSRLSGRLILFFYVLISCNSSVTCTISASLPITEWEKSYPQLQYFSTCKAVATPDGGIIVACDSLVNDGESRVFVIVRITAHGEIAWSATVQQDLFSARPFVKGAHLGLLSDGSVLVILDYDMDVHRIVKFDQNGRQISSNYLSLAGSALNIASIRETRRNKSIIIAGNLDNGNHWSPVVILLSRWGALQSISLFDTLSSSTGRDSNIWVSNAIIDRDDNFVLLYSSLEGDGRQANWTLLALDAQCRVHSKQSYKISGFELCETVCLRQNSTENFIIGGMSKTVSGDLNDRHAMVLLTDANGNLQRQYSTKLLADRLLRTYRAQLPHDNRCTVQISLLAIAPDGDMFVRAAFGETVRMWDVTGFVSSQPTWIRVDTTGLPIWQIPGSSSDESAMDLKDIVVVDASRIFVIGQGKAAQNNRNYPCMIIRKMREVKR